MTIRHRTHSQQTDRPALYGLERGGNSHPSDAKWSSIGGSLSILFAQATPRDAMRLLASFDRSAQGLDLAVARHQLKAGHSNEAGGTV